MMDDLKKRQAMSLLKASDLMAKLAQGTLLPVMLKSHETDGGETRVYAHASGVFELQKSLDGIVTVNGYTEEQHRKIQMAADAGLSQYALLKDSLIKENRVEELLSKHATMLRLKKAFEDSKGAIDVIRAFEKAELPPDEKSKMVSNVNPFGGFRRFHDRNPDNDPKGAREN